MRSSGGWRRSGRPSGGAAKNGPWRVSDWCADPQTVADRADARYQGDAVRICRAPTPAGYAMTTLSPDAIDTLFARLAAANPEPKSELEYTSPFTLLVAVVLSAQATDAGVNKATRGLFAAADTAAGMLKLGEEGVRHHIRTVGLFNTKAKNVIALCEILVAQHGGRVPRDRAALEALPGVGRKTANVVLNVAFGEPTIAVDTHIFRVANRTGLAPGKTPDKVEQCLLQVVPQRWRLHAHHWLILHGRYTCKARAPACPACALADLCQWPDKVRPGIADLTPGSKAPAAAPRRKPAAKRSRPV
ncbi:MAG: endonuclease III [Rhodospirillaceae bacterium]|nr:endonuclease III [Rhodospirillaceae bacterium]